MRNFNGKPIEDADEPLEIRVMPKDVKAAIPRDPCDCAIAKSLKRMKGVEQVRVGANVVLVEKKDKVMRYILAKEDRKKIRDFDIANYFRPDNYKLVPPAPAQKLGARRGTKSGTNVRTGKARTVYNSPPLRHALRPDMFKGNP